ncbi:hypothetical protein VKS41_001847 [Umbelopsis sp. WA50703]
MLTLLMIFTLVRVIDSIVLLTDVASNLIVRSFLFELPWQFGFAAFAVYLIGIATTLAQSHQAISTGWLPSSRQVDILAVFLIFAPFVTNNICSITAGVYAQQGRYYIADVITRMLYAFWSVYCMTLTAAVLYSGLRLVKIMGFHIRKFATSSQSSTRMDAIRNGRSKIVIIMLAIVFCLASFALMLLMYGIFRNEIMTHVPASILIGTIWNFLGPIAITFVEVAVATNPRLPSLGFKSYGTKGSLTDNKSFPQGSTRGWNSGISSSTFDQQNIQSMYSSNIDQPQQIPEQSEPEHAKAPPGLALNIIQYHKDNFVRTEEYMIGDIPRRANSEKSYTGLIQ